MKEWKLPNKQNSDYWERTIESRKESKIHKKREDRNPWTPLKG